MNREEQIDLNRKASAKAIESLKTGVKIIVFCVIGIFIFGVFQAILMPKRFPYVKSYDAGKMAGFYMEEDNSIDVLISSTSHASKGILPMEMYEKYGIKAYNLSTSIQPMEATYYLLSEALNVQDPNVFVFDVSSLYLSGIEKSYWWYVLDEMHFGKSKLAFAREYKRSVDNCDESMGELLIPLLRYHTRWKELNKRDFTVCFRRKHDYGKGGQINSVKADAGISVQEMNLITDELLQNTEKIEFSYHDEELRESREENFLYNVDIPEKNIEWFKKIKALCDENEIRLLAIKVPTIYLPQGYHSAWTEEKCSAVRSLCDEQGIAYYDLLYDTDAEIDWSNDTIDGGQHLNFYGAQKVSSDLGQYLKEHYELSEERKDQWEKDLLLYKEARNVAQLELQGDITTYLQMLAEKHQDKTIFISVSGDMTEGLETETVNALKALGLQADFSDAHQKSYIAIIEKGKVKYEAMSSHQLSYSGICAQSKESYNLFSSGWWTDAEASINVAGDELANKENEGVNIAVYDDEKALVIDAVCFDMRTKECIAIRNNTQIIGFEIAYERYMADLENRYR